MVIETEGRVVGVHISRVVVRLFETLRVEV